MGANVYLESVASFGYKTEAAATVITQDVDGKPGKRIAIRAFGFRCGATATNVYFMQVLGSTTTTGAVASGGSEMTLTAEPGPSGNSLATNDILVYVQDNGDYVFSKVKSLATLTVTLCTVATGAMAAGNTVYNMGIYSDTGHIPYKLTISTQTTKELDGGIFYATAKGYPMRIQHANDATLAGSIDYVTVDFLNK